MILPPTQKAAAKQLTFTKVALVFAVFAALWIIVSDKLPWFTVNDAALQGHIELAFIAVTSILLYLSLNSWREKVDLLPNTPK